MGLNTSKMTAQVLCEPSFQFQDISRNLCISKLVRARDEIFLKSLVHISSKLSLFCTAFIPLQSNAFDSKPPSSTFVKSGIRLLL